MFFVQFLCPLKSRKNYLKWLNLSGGAVHLLVRVLDGDFLSIFGLDTGGLLLASVDAFVPYPEEPVFRAGTDCTIGTLVFGGKPVASPAALSPSFKSAQITSEMILLARTRATIDILTFILMAERNGSFQIQNERFTIDCVSNFTETPRIDVSHHYSYFEMDFFFAAPKLTI